MAESNVNWHSECQNNKRPSGVFGVEAFATITSQLDAMNKKIEALAVSPSPSSLVEQCELCRGSHSYAECPHGNANVENFENANYIAGNFRNNQYGNTYHPGLCNHPNFSWRNQNVQNPPQRPYQPPPGFQQCPPAFQ